MNQPTVEQISDLIVQHTVSNFTEADEAARQIYALYNPPLKPVTCPSDEEIKKEAEFVGVLVSHIDTTFEDGFHVGVKWAFELIETKQ